jgi:hypothetical protein
LAVHQAALSFKHPLIPLNISMAGPQTLNGKVVLRVYTLDNSMKTLLIEPTSTVHVRTDGGVRSSILPGCLNTAAIYPPIVQDVCRMMAEKIGFADPEDDSLAFSLNECLDGFTSECNYIYENVHCQCLLTMRCAVGRALSPEREVLTIMESWFGKPEAKFIYQCKLYTDSIINSKDPKIIHMVFIQVRTPW